MKKLSIIIPVYNAEKYLEDCLKSICDEIDSRTELIIIDDGSKDCSKDIYSKFKGNNVKIFVNDNHGVSYTRNFGIEKASGKYIMFVDADDFLTNNWSSVIFNNINEYNDDFIIFINGISEKLSKEQLLDYNFQTDNSIKWISTPWSKLYKKSILDKNNIRFNGNIINGEDMLFNMEYINAIDSIKGIDCNIYNYRINPYSVTQSFKEKIFESDKIFLEELKNSNISPKYYNHCLENAIIMFLKKLTLLNENDRKKYFYIFNEYPYIDFINKNNNFESKKNKILINFVKKKKYSLAIKILIISKLIKRKNNKEYIIKI